MLIDDYLFFPFNLFSTYLEYYCWFLDDFIRWYTDTPQLSLYIRFVQQIPAFFVVLPWGIPGSWILFPHANMIGKKNGIKLIGEETNESFKRRLCPHKMHTFTKISRVKKIHVYFCHYMLMGHEHHNAWFQFHMSAQQMPCKFYNKKEINLSISK